MTRVRNQRPAKPGLMVTHPSFASEWHPTKNGELSPEKVSYGSNKIIWWLGECGHEWSDSPKTRSNQPKCPVCVGSKIIPGINDIFTRYPVLEEEWHPHKNTGVDPMKLTRGSGKRVWWQCSLGHDWDTQVNDRTNYGTHCPTCAGQRLLVGFNDLATREPKLAAQWHPAKNKKSVSEVFYRAREDAWWLCPLGHEWKSPVYSRQVSLGNCNDCGAGKVSSLEREIRDFIAGLLPGEELLCGSRRFLGNRELDIYLPNRKFAVEFNGVYWHTEEQGKGQGYHQDKYQRCRELGVTLIQIWEDDWKRDPELVKRVIAQRLGVSSNGLDDSKVTSLLTAGELTQQVAEEFMTANHLRGADVGSLHVGLVDPVTSEVIAAVSLSKSLNTDGTFVYQVERFACVRPVQGALGRLLAYVTEVNGVAAFSAVTDNCEGEDTLFKETGFTVTNELKPAFWYSVANIRKPVTDYPSERFRDDPALTWEDGLSVDELATLNGFDRIWDAGARVVTHGSLS